jgi:hypothetical protein
MVSPCVDVLRQLAARMHSELGSDQGAKHTIPNLEKDMETLMDSLTKHKVYQVKVGRVLDPQDSPVPDVLSTGLAALSHGSSTNPLAEFNAQFDRLRERRKLLPISVLLNNTLVLDDPPGPHSPHASEPEPDDTTMEEIDKDDPLEITQPSDDEVEDEPDDNLFAESPTLTRLDEGDIALDMYDWTLEDEYEDGTDSEED